MCSTRLQGEIRQRWRELWTFLSWLKALCCIDYIWCLDVHRELLVVHDQSILLAQAHAMFTFCNTNCKMTAVAEEGQPQWSSVVAYYHYSSTAYIYFACASSLLHFKVTEIRPYLGY